MPGPMSSGDNLVVCKQKYFKMYKLDFNVPSEFDFVTSWFGKKKKIFMYSNLIFKV